MPDPMPGPTSHQFVSQGLRLHYVDWGNRGAPTLVLIHGSLDHARSWDDIACRLRDGWHVVCVDLRGHGDSQWSPDAAYMAPYFVYDLKRLIDDLGGEQLSLVGHSLGGAIAVRYAGLFPQKVRRLVAIEGLGLSPDKEAQQRAVPITARWREWIERRHLAALRAPHAYASIDEAEQRMRTVNPHLSPTLARHLTVHGVIRSEDGSYRWKFDPQARRHGPFDHAGNMMKDFWQAIECPVLLFYGAQSWASNPEHDGRAGHFKDARTLVLDGAGHWVHHDRPDLFVAETLRFLQ